MSDTLDDLLADAAVNPSPKEPISKCVVRLTTSMWHDGDGIYMKRSLRFLRRQCTGYNVVYEDAQIVGANEVLPKIINLDDCKDGIYEVVVCNEWGAWETPHMIEDYDYKLIPYELKEIRK